MIRILPTLLLVTAACSFRELASAEPEPLAVQTGQAGHSHADHAEGQHPPQASASDEDHSGAAVRRAPDDLSEREAATVELFQQSVKTVVLIRARQARAGIGRGEPGSSSLGSGVLISAQNHILTAAHVIDGAEDIRVQTAEGRTRKAVRVFSEPGADLALLQLEEPDAALPFAPLGDSDRLAVGQDVFVIGNPRGLENSFSRGVLSGFREFGRLYDGSILVEFLQTDAAINSGNSGGPIFDSHGRVVAIASRISTRSGGSEGLGFAVTINSAKQLLALEERSWTGLDGVFLDPSVLVGIFHLELSGALLVQRVETGSPAERAGLRGGTVHAEVEGRELILGGDLILQIGEQEACHSRCLAAADDRLQAEDRVTVVFLRAGKIQSTVLELESARRNFLNP